MRWKLVTCFFTATMILGISSHYFYEKRSNPSQDFFNKGDFQAKATTLSQMEDKSPSISSDNRQPTPQTATEVQSERTHDPATRAWQDALKTVDIRSEYEVLSAVALLRKAPVASVAEYFLSELENLEPGQDYERDKLLILANSLQEPANLAFWEDLAFRRTPRYSNEKELLHSPHPTLESRFINLEQSQAIKHIGLIAYRDPKAKRLLEQIILQPDRSIHKPFCREQAFFALREADFSSSLRILNKLDSNDDLRGQLHQYLILEK